MDIKISIVLPTKNRPGLLSRLLESIAETAQHPEQLEVVLYVDSDDKPTQEVDHPSLRLVKIIGQPAKMGVMTRTCFQKSTGQYVMLLNDDAVCRTTRWDTAILNAFKRFDDDILLTWCNDLHRGSGIPSFPILSRKVCDLIGGVCPGDYDRDYIDTHIFDIFKKLSALKHDRMVYLKDVVIEHLHHETGKAGFDSTYVKVRQESDELAFIAWDQQRQIIAENMARCIEGGNR